MNVYPKIDTEQLANVLAQTVQFSMDDYQSEEYPESVGWNCAYVCACFLAQHTKHGTDGVEAEGPLSALQIGTPMPFNDRLALAKDVVTAWSEP